MRALVTVAVGAATLFVPFPLEGEVAAETQSAYLSSTAAPQSRIAPPFESQLFPEDITWADGYYVRWPGGTAGSEPHDSKPTTSAKIAARQRALREQLEVYGHCLATVPRPSGLEELTDGYTLFFYSLEEETAASLGLIGLAEVSGDKKSSVWVHRFAQFRRAACTLKDGATLPVIWGAGTEMIAHVRRATRKASLTGLPSIAASVTLGSAEVEFRMSVLGITGAPVGRVLPTGMTLAGKLNVEGYGQVISSADRIRELMHEPGVTVTPQLMIQQDDLSAALSRKR